MAELMLPVERAGGTWVLEFGQTYFEVTPSHGARVTSLRQAGQELLVRTGSANFADAFGSTFWPSPQRWPWPPPAEIDTLPYEVRVDGAQSITASAAVHPETQLRVQKRFAANLPREAIELEYALTNTGAEPASWAPWEITRMPARGLAFWPTGGAPFGTEPLVTSAAAGHTWCEPAQTRGEAKTFADGAGGYLAYVVGDRILIKQFQDQPEGAAAPGEAEIELYVNADHSYVEVENQGAYALIAPGATLSWRVTWYVRRLPVGLDPSPGSEDLVAFVAKTLQ